MAHTSDGGYRCSGAGNASPAAVAGLSEQLEYENSPRAIIFCITSRNAQVHVTSLVVYIFFSPEFTLILPSSFESFVLSSHLGCTSFCFQFVSINKIYFHPNPQLPHTPRRRGGNPHKAVWGKRKTLSKNSPKNSPKKKKRLTKDIKQAGG